MERNPERLKWIKEMNEKPDIPLSYPNFRIGKNCNIHRTVIFDDPSYTLEREIDGTFVRGKQFGGIFIGDNVEIAPFCNIHRATLPDAETIIGDGTKICSFVNVGHNSKIGKHVFIGPLVNLDGSVEIGDYCYIAPHVQINWHRKVGQWSIIGAGSVVTKDIPSYSLAYGVPAKVIKEVNK